MGDGLIRIDRKGPIGIRQLVKSGIQKKMTRHPTHCSQHRFVLDPFGAQLIDQLLSKSLMP
jgi:hypothetical protein